MLQEIFFSDDPQIKIAAPAQLCAQWPDACMCVCSINYMKMLPYCNITNIAIALRDNEFNVASQF